LKEKDRLGIALHEQERYPEAEEVLRQVVLGREKVLGIEHVDTLNCKFLSNLGNRNG